MIPPEDLERDLWEIKKEMSARFDSHAALRSPPHITLHMPFRYRSDRQESLIHSLLDFARKQKPFEVELNGFGAFPPRVIYVDVIPNGPMQELQKGLLDFMKKEHNIFNANYRDRPFRPHLTVAFRDLKKSRFDEAWLFVQDRTLEMSWSALGMYLLIHNGKNWECLQECLFEGF
nr:2'-5' RNA ligase family protein [Fulvivirga sedimenti]